MSCRAVIVTSNPRENRAMTRISFRRRQQKITTARGSFLESAGFQAPSQVAADEVNGSSGYVLLAGQLGWLEGRRKKVGKDWYFLLVSSKF